MSAPGQAIALTCCFIPCEAAAEFGILSEGHSCDLETHACTVHVGALLEDGISSVYPIGPAPAAPPTSITDEFDQAI